MSASTTPSAQPATTAAQAIALAVTTDQVVGLTSPPPTASEKQHDSCSPQPAENTPPRDDDAAPQAQSVEQTPVPQEQPPANPTPKPVQPQNDKPPPDRLGQPHLQPLAPRAPPAQGQPTGQPHLGPPPQGPPPQGHPQQGQPYPGQPPQYAVGPGGQPLYYYALQQNQTPQYQPLGPLQPLPRGRPPRPKPPPQPQGSVWGTQPSVQEGVRKPPLGPAYTRGGHLLGGYNPARYMGVSNANPHFDTDGKFLYLTGPSNIRSWIQEITCVARALSCFDEMTKRFVGFPPPNTVQLFICETRFATAWRVLEGTIAGQVWAYMRVLGYSSIPANPENPLMSPTPADCYEFAQRAASRMLVPGTPEQPKEERKRMVEEILTAQATEYPSERSYKKGIKWLRLACDSLIKQGDYALAVSLYNPIPDWAPKPADWEDPAPEETGADGAGSTASPRGNKEQPVPCVSASASPVEQAVEAPPPAASANGTPSSAVPTPNPPQAKAKKRKRPHKDDGTKAAQAKNTRPESTAGA